MKNEVNRALVAKKNVKYIVLGLLMSMTLSVNARMYPTRVPPKREIRNSIGRTIMPSCSFISSRVPTPLTTNG